MGQRIFSGTDYGFRWTNYNWYVYDGKEAECKALKARNAFWRELKAQGHNPRKFSLGNQLKSFGGIGTDKPDIQVWTKAYGVNW